MKKQKYNINNLQKIRHICMTDEIFQYQRSKVLICFPILKTNITLFVSFLILALIFLSSYRVDGLASEISRENQESVLLMIAREFPEMKVNENLDISPDILESHRKKLSLKMKIQLASVIDGEEKYSKVYRYRITSGFSNIKIKNIRIVKSRFIQRRGNLVGKVKEWIISSTSIKPGEVSFIEITVLFPQNWSFKKKESFGTLFALVGGEMVLESKLSPEQLQSPDSAKPFLTCPLVPKEIKELVSIEIPPEKSLLLIIPLVLFTIIGIPAAFIYQTLVPVTVTLRMGKKSKSYNLVHKGIIAIGGKDGFEIPDCDVEIARIQKRFRRFVLIEKQEKVIPQTYKIRRRRITLKLGGSFELNIKGSPVKFEFLPGIRDMEEIDETSRLEIPDEEIDESSEEKNSGTELI